MAVSWGLKRALRNRTRRFRRFEVGWFFFLMAMGLLYAGRPFRLSDLGVLSIPLMYAVGRIFCFWRWQQVLPVSSLDDRAVLEYGVEFEGLDEARQKKILGRYRVGTYLLNYYPDELEEAQEHEAHLRAYGVLKVLLPILAVIYWAGWRLLPEGRLRAGWTDGPVVLTWVLLLVLALPQLIRMWTEPDEVGEPRVV
jgi:hypothetical protein